MDAAPDFHIETDAAGARRLVLTGPLTIVTAGALDRRLRDAGDAGAFTTVDIAAVTAIDTVGAWLVSRALHSGDRAAELTGGDAKARRLVDAVSAPPVDAPPEPEPPPRWQHVPEAVGRGMVAFGHGSIAMLGFFGAVLVVLAAAVRNPRRLRFTAIVAQMQQVGVDSLGIIALMSFLVGVVIAQQGAVQLQQFGAEIYTVNLTGRIALRELGILMTAIMVAGRSGSAFAAQIGTMKLTEEIDAMRTIGVSPIEALVVPRVIAGVVMMPLLGVYAAVIAIIGGATISMFQLGIPFISFLLRVREVVPTNDFWVGVIKAPVFGLIIALTGCFQGMQVEGNSEDVGVRTTKAVVQGIFMAIVLDAFFAVFFTEVGWI